MLSQTPSDGWPTNGGKEMSAWDTLTLTPKQVYQTSFTRQSSHRTRLVTMATHQELLVSINMTSYSL